MLSFTQLYCFLIDINSSPTFVFSFFNNHHRGFTHQSVCINLSKSMTLSRFIWDKDKKMTPEETFHVISTSLHQLIHHINNSNFLCAISWTECTWKYKDSLVIQEWIYRRQVSTVGPFRYWRKTAYRISATLACLLSFTLPYIYLTVLHLFSVWTFTLFHLFNSKYIERATLTPMSSFKFTIFLFASFLTHPDPLFFN